MMGGIYREPTARERHAQPWSRLGVCFYVRVALENSLADGVSLHYRRDHSDVQIAVYLIGSGGLLIDDRYAMLLDLGRGEWAYCRIGAEIDGEKRFWTLRPHGGE